MNATMIPYEAWQQLEQQYPEASRFLYIASLKEEIRYNETRAQLTNNSDHEKQIVQQVFALREKLRELASQVEESKG